MKTLFKISLLFVLSAFMFSSCLKLGLDALPAYSDAEIMSFKFEYRWYDETVGLGRMYVQELKVSNLVIDSETAGISLDLTVPPVSESFPESERNKVGLGNIVGYCDISTAATIAPVDNAPVLGVLGDWSSKDFMYKVTAADGTEKVWSLHIGAFNK